MTGSAPVTEICAPIGIMRRLLTTWLGPSYSAADDAGAGGKR